MGGFLPDAWNGWFDDFGALTVAAGGLGVFWRFVLKPIGRLIDLVHDAIEKLHDAIEKLIGLADRVDKGFKEVQKVLDDFERRLAALEQRNPEGDNK